MQLATLKDGRALEIDRASPTDAATILDFLRTAVSESDNLISEPADFDIPVEQEAEWLRSMLPLKDACLLCGKVEGDVAAFASLTTPRRRRIAHTSEVSLIVGRAFWSMGAGGAMLQALIDFARGSGTLTLLHLGVRQGNTRAEKLYSRYGFQHTGCIKNFMCINGKYYDEHKMCLVL